MPGQPQKVTKATLPYILHLLEWGRGSKTPGLIPKGISALLVRARQLLLYLKPCWLPLLLYLNLCSPTSPARPKPNLHTNACRATAAH